MLHLRVPPVRLICDVASLRLVVIDRAVRASTIGTAALTGLNKRRRQHVPGFLVMSVKEEQQEGEA